MCLQIYKQGKIKCNIGLSKLKRLVFNWHAIHAILRPCNSRQMTKLQTIHVISQITSSVLQKIYAVPMLSVFAWIIDIKKIIILRIKKKVWKINPSIIWNSDWSTKIMKT